MTHSSAVVAQLQPKRLISSRAPRSMADTSGLAPESTTDPTQQLAALRAELEASESNRTLQTIESEQLLHDLAGKLATAERQLEQERLAVQQATAREQQEKERVVGLEEQLKQERERQAGHSKDDEERRHREEQLAREKRDLMDVYERSEADKKQLDGESHSLSVQAHRSWLAASIWGSSARRGDI